MNVAPDSRPFGVAPSILVDCAVQLRDEDTGFSLDDFCEALGAPRREAEPVLLQMIQEGYIETADGDGGNTFRPSTKLRQLAVASISNGVPRAQAERFLQRVIFKAAEINAHPDEYPYSVSRLVVFGSYLGDKEVLGDLDIAVELGSVRSSASDELSVNFRRLLDLDSAARKKTLAALRLRKPKLISVHLLGEVIRLGTQFRVVFEASTC